MYHYQRSYRGSIRALIMDLAGTCVDFGSTAPIHAFKQLFADNGVMISGVEARAPMGSEKREHIRALLAMPRIAELPDLLVELDGRLARGERRKADGLMLPLPLWLGLDATHPASHSEPRNHNTLPMALQIIERLKVPMAYLTHISHVLDAENLHAVPDLPANVRLARDGEAFVPVAVAACSSLPSGGTWPGKTSCTVLNDLRREGHSDKFTDNRYH